MNAHRSLQRRLAGLAATGVVAMLATGLADPAAARSNRQARPDESNLSRPAGTPVMAIVSIGEQRVSIYDAEGRILRAPVSTGQRGYETPAGIYSVIQKNAEHYSNLYDDASMPFMQRITWSGIALHAGALPGYPASHGCIRMPYNFAERLFDLTKMGMRVVVMPHEATPVAIAHPGLFKPKPVGGDVAAANPTPGGEPGQRMRLGGLSPDGNVPPTTLPPGTLQTLRSIAAAKSAEAEATARKADEARLAATRSTGEAVRAAKAVRLAEGARNRAETQLKAAEQALESAVEPDTRERGEEAKAKAAAKVAETGAQLETARADAAAKAEAAVRAREEAKGVEAAKVEAANAAKEAAARMSPVSVFISRQTQRIHVRQAFQPLFDMPLTIRDPDQPIGTHIYTALDYINGGADVRWSAVSMTRSAEGREADSGSRRQRSAERNSEAPATDVGGAKAALDRITIPQEAADRIAEVVSPGSSLIVSDEPISKETGKGTDFIIVMSGEPQGGIKIRRRPQPYGDYGRGYGRSPYGRSPSFWGGW